MTAETNIYYKPCLLVLSSWYPNKKNNLDGNFVRNHVQAMSKDYYVKVVYTTSLQTITNYEIEEFEEENYLELYVYFPYHKFKLVRLYRKLNAYRIGIKRVGVFHLINAHVFFNIGVIAIITSFISRKKLFITEHSSRFSKLSLVDKLLFKISHPFVHKFIPVSSFLQKKFKELGVPENKIEIVFNTIDTDIFTIKKTTKADTFKFLHISKFDDPNKNVLGILEAFQRIANKNKNVTLEIIGDGDQSILQQWIQELQIPSIQIQNTGVIANHELPAYYANVSCFILFSNFENNPMVLIEALCCGIPIIASKVGGIPDFINETNGILVEANNINALEMAMLQMIETNSAYNKNSIRNSIVEKVSRKGVTATYSKIFME
jgi:glycosyltransferase involved in cell wall biosynthesis